ncbi:MAG: hypothetical protein HY402_01225 [Elusimicrobia bacterium]|nr:hypothetical protein [Elusimicrobiota bacterium]
MKVFLIFFILLSPSSLRAAKLDVQADYRLRGVTYSNVDLDSDTSDSQAFYSQKALLGLILKDISLGTRGGKEQKLEVALRLQALNLAGSTSSVRIPFDRIASRYPSTDFTPWFQHAYLQASDLLGWDWKLTVGRQPFKLGGGLILDDDDLGFTGIKIEAALPWWKMQTQLFTAKAREGQTGDADADLHGISLKVPTQGTWAFSYLLERNRTLGTLLGRRVGTAAKSFLGAHYLLQWENLTFDGEAAWQVGQAESRDPAQGDIDFSGFGAIAQGAWRQPLGRRFGVGYARLLFGMGSGDHFSTSDKDEAFFPGFGHRFDGLERAGLGQYFGATLYDALASTTATRTGLHPDVSGIQVVGMGLTPPPWKGIFLDLDFFSFRASESRSIHRSLGDEFDLQLRYPIADHLYARASAAFFSPGPALKPAGSKGSSQRYLLEIRGRF